ncbi:MEDS domain-containing protein [Krasilnikovia sp. MM14-A1004]|uniref:MEDS domain-containing protein n=1 Tax=Krasilnikovia sp. MM14-A1004 TaxID=3373541 RepID=UPI00399CEC8E
MTDSRDSDAVPGWDGHLLLLHSSEDERRAALAAWVRRGLERGEKVIYTEGPAAARDSLSSVLQAHGLDAEAAQREGRLAVLPLAEFYPPHGQDAVVGRALAEGFPAVRLSAQAGAALSLLSPRAYLRAERDIERLCRTRTVSSLCQYRRATTIGTWLAKAVGVHLPGIRHARLATSGAGRGLRVCGELDVCNVEVFGAVLTAAIRRTARTVWLDLAAVDVVDAAACRMLVEASDRFRTGGGRVLLVGPQAHVDQVMRRLDLDLVPGMHLVGGDP